MSLLRLAIVGCGAVAERCHLPALALSGKARPTILGDANLTRARELARRFSVPGTTDDYRTIFGQVDAAIVALPHYLHAPVSADLLSHGIHVLVEKPMATTAAECDTMIEAANKSGVTLAVGIVRRFLPSYAFVQAPSTPTSWGPSPLLTSARVWSTTGPSLRTSSFAGRWPAAVSSSTPAPIRWTWYSVGSETVDRWTIRTMPWAEWKPTAGSTCAWRAASKAR